MDLICWLVTCCLVMIPLKCFHVLTASMEQNVPFNFKMRISLLVLSCHV